MYIPILAIKYSAVKTLSSINKVTMGTICSGRKLSRTHTEEGSFGCRGVRATIQFHSSVELHMSVSK